MVTMDPDHVQRCIEELLGKLHTEQVAVGHVGGAPLSLGDIRWDLERLNLAAPENAEVLKICADEQLRRTLNATEGWRATGNGWQLQDPDAEVSVGAIGARRLKERREAEATPALPTRTLSLLVQLLRDSSYERVKLSIKLQQLAHICAAELSQLDAAPSARSLKVPYLSGKRADHPGAIDAGVWKLASDAYPTGVNVPSIGQAGSARCRPLAGEVKLFELCRTITTAVFPANKGEQQQVAFACDAAAALRFMLSRAGTSRGARLSILLDQLMPVMNALATSQENAHAAAARAAQTHAHLAFGQSRTAIEADLDMIAVQLEAYSLRVLTFLDGDSEIPSLEVLLRPTIANLSSALKVVLRAMLPEEDRASQHARHEARKAVAHLARDIHCP
jgi:hypothetical protein